MAAPIWQTTPSGSNDSIACWKCKKSVSKSDLERHAREELIYYVFRCFLCGHRFLTEEMLTEVHLPLRHPGAHIQVLQDIQIEKERALMDILNNSGRAERQTMQIGVAPTIQLTPAPQARRNSELTCYVRPSQGGVKQERSESLEYQPPEERSIFLTRCSLPIQRNIKTEMPSHEDSYHGSQWNVESPASSAMIYQNTPFKFVNRPIKLEPVDAEESSQEPMKEENNSRSSENLDSCNENPIVDDSQNRNSDPMKIELPDQSIGNNTSSINNSAQNQSEVVGCSNISSQNHNSPQESVKPDLSFKETSPSILEKRKKRPARINDSSDEENLSLNVKPKIFSERENEARTPNLKKNRRSNDFELGVIHSRSPVMLRRKPIVKVEIETDEDESYHQNESPAKPKRIILRKPDTLSTPRQKKEPATKTTRSSTKKKSAQKPRKSTAKTGKATVRNSSRSSASKAKKES